MPDDPELMARVTAGEQSALELLFARWEGPLFAYFHRLGCHPSWTEDLVEETLVTVYRRRDRYDPSRPFAPWLYGIARLVWKDHLRHRGRDLYGAASLVDVEGAPADEPDALRAAQRWEEAEVVRSAIQGLSMEQREAFILRHYHGLSYDEIAKVVEAPLGTVKWRIHEAMRRLQHVLIHGGVRESTE
jgi:RNA polymerase sigma-70 factor (ECF subfamily)